MGFTDLHCHLLPGVDDGPSTMAESLEYAATAAAAGTTTIVATPHVELVDVAEIPDRVRTLRAALEAEGVSLDVRCGGELKHFSIPGMSDADLETIAHGPPGARWLLYEVPFEGADEEFVAGARELRERGFGLLLAHPERSRGMVDDGGVGVIEALVADGALVAANTGPLLGREGGDRKHAAELLLRRGTPGVVATDAHAPRRPYTLAMACDAVADVTGRPDLARRLATETPARLLTEGIAAGRRAA
ncbi:MAG: CpsB/CapC family capsule biosynthesis tyrosine phosphatase [Ornithinibacter sp.]